MRIRDFNPPDDLLRVPIQALKDILDKGHAFMTLPNGQVIRITKKDLHFKKDEVEKFIQEELKKQKIIGES